jgi:hypothetical protein
LETSKPDIVAAKEYVAISSGLDRHYSSNCTDPLEAVTEEKITGEDYVIVNSKDFRI